MDDHGGNCGSDASDVAVGHEVAEVESGGMGVAGQAG
jgi:hypothetical protein